MTNATGEKVRIPSRTLLDCHDFDVPGVLSGRLRRAGGQTQVEVFVDNGKKLVALWVKPRNLYVQDGPLDHAMNNYKWGELLQ